MEQNQTKVATLRSASDCYRKFALIDLIKRIAELGDKRALAEFHNNRTIFQVPEKGWVCLSDYLNHLREVAAIVRWKPGNAFEQADRAYDLTLDKFNNLPKKLTNVSENPSENNTQLKRPGPNCRYYYRAFINHIERTFEENPPKGLLDVELRAAQAFKRFVNRHFLLSMLEAKRNSNPFWSRYFWSVKGYKISLWLPIYLKGQQRRKWLEKNIKDPYPTRPLERDRIQGIINRRLANLVFVPFDPDRIGQLSGPFLTEKPTSEKFGSSLAQVVAEEKTANIDEQRQAIRKLGEKKLNELILRIFESAEDGDTTDAELAHEFGLSKATYSRFAGSLWHKSKGKCPPDLWVNTAQVLAMDPSFKETVIAAGAWKQIQSVLKNSDEG